MNDIDRKTERCNSIYEFLQMSALDVQLFKEEKYRHRKRKHQAVIGHSVYIKIMPIEIIVLGNGNAIHQHENEHRKDSIERWATS